MGSIKSCTKLVHFVQFFSINKFKDAMSELNITYKREEAKVDRNKNLYNDYKAFRDSGDKYDEAMYKLVSKYGISRTRVASIIAFINKQLKNSKK